MLGSSESTREVVPGLGGAAGWNGRGLGGRRDHGKDYAKLRERSQVENETSCDGDRSRGRRRECEPLAGLFENIGGHWIVPPAPFPGRLRRPRKPGQNRIPRSQLSLDIPALGVSLVLLLDPFAKEITENCRLRAAEPVSRNPRSNSIWLRGGRPISLLSLDSVPPICIEIHTVRSCLAKDDDLNLA